MPSKVRASLTGVSVSCGVINFEVDLVPATRAKADKRAANNTSLTRACPSCEAAVPVHQKLYCEKGHGPLAQNALHHATTTADGGLRKVPEAAVAATTTPVVDPRTVAFSVVPADQLESATLPSGNVYRMRLPKRPSSATTQAYALLLELVADPELAFISELVVKGVSKLYRGVARDGMLTLTELYRPSLFHEPDGADVSCSERMLVAGRAMVAELVADFDPDGWESDAALRLHELRAAAVAGERPEVPAVAPATAAAEDLLHLLADAA